MQLFQKPFRWQRRHISNKNSTEDALKLFFPRHRDCQSERPTKTYNSTLQTGSKLQCNLSSEPTRLFAVEVRSSLWVDGGGGAAASAGAEIRTWVTESGPCCLQVWHRSCDSREVQVTQPSSDRWLAWLVGLHRLKQKKFTWEEEFFCSLVTCQINFTVGVNPNMQVLYLLCYFIDFHSIVSIQQNETPFTCENTIQRIVPFGSQRSLASTTPRTSLLSNTRTSSFERLVMPKNIFFYL